MIAKSLSEFLQQAILEVNNGCSAIRFVELRYDIMGRQWPTGIWSTNEVRLDIFQEILDYITGIKEIPLQRPNRTLTRDPIDKNDYKDPYWTNFVDWIHKHKIKS